MGRTVKDVLIHVLENLEEKSFKKFKNKLNDTKIKEGYNKIPRGTLQGADALDTADLILRFYKDRYGIELTRTVLEEIDEKKEAEELQKAITKVTSSTSQEAATGEGHGATSRAQAEETSQRATSEDEEHFVDRHRSKLIARVHLLGPILDDLYQEKLLTSEDCSTVTSKSTAQNQMRELFRYVDSWGNRDKDKFLKSLSDHNAPLIRNLEDDAKCLGF
ncbi:apoptosis-associated speck-like protein containing a CARD isoform 1-T1 [Anomaloglossus baeobatrachus]